MTFERDDVLLRRHATWCAKFDCTVPSLFVRFVFISAEDLKIYSCACAHTFSSQHNAMCARCRVRCALNLIFCRKPIFANLMHARIHNNLASHFQFTFAITFGRGVHVVSFVCWWFLVLFVDGDAAAAAAAAAPFQCPIHLNAYNVLKGLHKHIICFLSATTFFMQHIPARSHQPLLHYVRENGAAAVCKNEEKRNGMEWKENGHCTQAWQPSGGNVEKHVHLLIKPSIYNSV